jgi:hypothetical protein
VKALVFSPTATASAEKVKNEEPVAQTRIPRGTLHLCPRRT